MNWRKVRLLSGILITILAAAPSQGKDRLEAYFKDQHELVRLSAPRADLIVGRMVVVRGVCGFWKKNRGFLYDSFLQFYDEAARKRFLSDPPTAVVFPGFEQNTKHEVNVAAELVDSIFPGLSGQLKLTSTSKVTITQFEADLQTMSELRWTELLHYWGDMKPEMQAKMHSFVTGKVRKCVKPYLITSTVRVKKLDLSAEAGVEIVAGLAVGETKHLKSGKASVKVTRNEKHTLSLGGDQAYVLAVAGYRIRATEEHFPWKIPLDTDRHLSDKISYLPSLTGGTLHGADIVVAGAGHSAAIVDFETATEEAGATEKDRQDAEEIVKGLEPLIESEQ